ncbi:MAG: short-chain dehydrogenase/reductase [Planctomycetaceae bacterium]|nr:short-chain dehydrogenase/reductase [Planctomycetaceae bacterium]
MSRSLEGQVAVVVGASSGMGQAIARGFAAAGVNVMAAARRESRLQRLCAEFPSRIRRCQTDVTVREQVQHLIAETVAAWNRIDVLVYATGTNLPDRSLEKLSDNGWTELMATNLTGAFYCTQEVLRVMRRQGAGLIIYLSTGAVQRPDISGVAYQASKHGLTGLAHGTRVEERERGIRTSIIFPGLCETEILSKRPTPTPREVLDKALLPEDVADAVLFLAQLPARAVVPEMQLLPSRL